MLPSGPARTLDTFHRANARQPVGKPRAQDSPVLDDDASPADRTVVNIETLSPEFGSMDTDEAGTTAEVLGKLASRNSTERLDMLCDSIGLQQLEDRANFKKKFHEHMTGHTVTLTPEEDAALNRLTQSIAEAARTYPGARGKGAQVVNTGVAASIAWAFSFLPLTTIVAATGQSLKADSLHFFALAGPLILLSGDVLAGSFIQQGAGYVPRDQMAYLDYHTHVSQLNRLQLKMAGVRHAGRQNTGEYEDLAGRHKALQLKTQVVCTGLIERELGQVLGLRNDPHEADVPQIRLLGCIRSRLTADDNGKVCLPDGTHLFTYNAGGASGSFKVTWPDGSGPTDLRSEVIPRQHREAFARAEGLLLGAARTRSLFCDEATGLSFALFYGIHGVAGPFLHAATDNSVTADTASNLAASFCSLQGVFHGGNAMLSWLSGAKPHAAPSQPENHARLAHADLRVETLQTRVRELDDLRVRLETELSNLHTRKARIGELMAAPDREQKSATNLKEALARCNAQIALRKQAGLQLKSHARDAVKALAAAQLDRGKSSGKLAATWAGAKEIWKGHAENVPRLLARLAGYSLPYLMLAEVFLRYVSLLAPPAPGSETPGANETAFNQTAGVPAHAWNPFLSVIWANGLQVAMLFGARHLVTARALEYGFDAIAGAGEYVAARLGRGGQAQEDILFGSPEDDSDSSDDDGGGDASVESTAHGGSASSSASGDGKSAPPAHAQRWASKKDELCRTLSPAQFRAIGEVLQHLRPGTDYSLNSVLKEKIGLDTRQRIIRCGELDQAVRLIRHRLREIFGRHEANELRKMLDAMMDTTESLV
jgi:hypothetical protein